MKKQLAKARPDVAFWAALVAAQLLVLLVAVYSPLIGVVLVAAFGLLAFLALTLGTQAGTLAIGSLLLVATVVLPGDIALRYRVPLGGGGIFAVDVLLALLLASMLAALLSRERLTMVRSPVSLPLLLFLLWTAVAAVVGALRGNDPKLILQDARGLSYFALFFFIVLFVHHRRQLLTVLRVLALCLVAVFALGVFYAAMGLGMQLEFVEAGVSRFPAPDEVFLMASTLLAGFVAAWPSARRRPTWLWALLFIALLGLVLSYVRGNYVAFVVGFVYLLAVLQVRERLRLVAGGLAVVAILGAALAVARPDLFRSVVTRALAVTEVNDRNVQYRLIENTAVAAQIAEHPVVGNGLGREYLFDWSRYGVAPYRKSYIHNNYYWFTHRLGLVGMGLFVWVAAAFLFPWLRDRTTLSRGDPWLVGLVFGSRAMFVSLLVVSITSPRLNGKLSVAVAATILGLAEVARVVLVRKEEQALGLTVECDPGAPGRVGTPTEPAGGSV